jgi:hypothetical protein
MKAILPALVRVLQQAASRWAQQARSIRRVDRWTGWARALMGRYVWIPLRQRAAAMQLLEQRAPLGMPGRRWELAALNIHPKLRLSISPLLFRTTGKGAPAVLAVPAPGGYDARQRQGGIASAPPLAAPASGRQGTPAQRAPIDQWQGRRTPVGSGMRLVLPGALGADRAGAPGAAGSQQSLPLARVFRRLNAADLYEVGTVSRRHREHLAAQRSLRILDPVTEALQRVEYRVQRTAVVLRRQSRDITAPAVKSVAAPAPAPPAIDIGQLTEQVVRQIDNRIIAHRERMGDVF